MDVLPLYPMDVLLVPQPHLPYTTVRAPLSPSLAHSSLASRPLPLSLPGPCLSRVAALIRVASWLQCAVRDPGAPHRLGPPPAAGDVPF